MTGRIVLVGAGPGDPELLTIRGARALADADVVVYDRLVAPSLLELAQADAERIYVGKEPGRAAVPQRRVPAQLGAEPDRGRLDDLHRVAGGAVSQQPGDLRSDEAGGSGDDGDADEACEHRAAPAHGSPSSPMNAGSSAS